MNTMVVAAQVGALAIVMLLGFLAVKTGYLDIKIKDSISKLIVNLILPCLIISSISSKELKPELLGNLGVVFLMSFFCIATLFLIGVITAKVLKIPDGTSAVHKLLFTCGNVIFIGYPIIVAMYGETGFFYAIIYWLMNDLFLWTVGVIMLTKNKTDEKKGFAKQILNPNTISFAVAILMLIFGIKLPSFLQEATSGVGGLTTYLSMIFIGMALATVDIKRIVKKWWILILTPLKLVIIPIGFMFLFKSFGIKEMLLGVVVLETAMPAQTVLSILAYEHRADGEYAAVAMFITTIASLFTLPLICHLLQIWL